MPTEIIPSASGGFDILPWVLVVLLGCMCAYLTYRLVNTSKPKSAFEDWEICRELNAKEGPRSNGRWVFTIVLGIDGHIISTARTERFEGFIYQKSGKKIWETKPDSIWNLAGVPTIFVWGDRYTAIDIEAGEAIQKKISMKAELRKMLKKEEGEKKEEEDPARSRDGWYKNRLAWDDNEPETVGAPWHIIDIVRMRDLVASTTPSSFFNIASRINTIVDKKGSGLLSWILSNPLILVLGAVAVVVVIIFFT